MKFTASSALLASVALLSAMSAVSADGIVQAWVKPLQTKPGGIVTVTVNFVVDSLDSTRRLTTTDNPFTAGLYTDTSDYSYSEHYAVFNKNNNDTKKNTTHKSNKHGDDDTITIRSAKIVPNTWKPKVKAEIEQLGEGELAFFELPEDDVVLDKEYKITYKVRIGKGVDSGLFVFPTFLTGPGLSLIENLEVLVK